MAEILISVAAKVAEYLVAPVVRPLRYLFNYRSNLDKLQEQVEKLGDARGRLQRKVDEADRQGDEIQPDVQKWLTRTEGIIQKANELIEDEKAANTSCFNLKLRYQRSRLAKKQSGDIGKIQEENKFDSVSYRLPPQGIWSPRLRDCEALESRASILNKIMEALRSDDIRMIGVWGMGGVGKTTLANQVAKKAEEDKLFEKVVMALNISQVPNVAKIQGEIASMLGLKFEKEEELERADGLRKSLNKHKTLLVILDDIWEELSLEQIGIPYGDVHKGCKVLLTSREHSVLSREMGTQKNFHVQHLCEEEAWSLFKKTAGDSVEKPQAVEIVKECEGLPVAIVTIAKALKGESVAVWKNALDELKKSAPTNIKGVSKNVYSCLELSYNHLEGDEVKGLFLLCGMLGPGDISMDQLVKYGMGLDLFVHTSSLEQITNKLVTLVKILKDSSLLLDVENGYGSKYEWPGVLFGYNDEKKYVGMHDVIRDVARAIAAKDPHRFVVIQEALGLEEWQMKEESRDCSRISLKCRDLHELPERLVCPKLEFLILNVDVRSPGIPNAFFEKMVSLRVLDLPECNLTLLPSSVGFLSNLRTLCVRGCYVEDIAVIGNLKKLQVLCFTSSNVERLPKEMTQLTDLRVLDLRGCSDLKVIPRNVISSLSRLEHLSLAEGFAEWGADGFGNGESNNNVCLSELNNLSNLKTLCIEIGDPNLLSTDLTSVFGKLTRYVILVSTKEHYVHDYESSRSLKLRGVNRSRFVDCFSKLLKTVDDLELWDLDGTEHALCELHTEDFLQLKRLRIWRSPGIQYIVSSTQGVGLHRAFPILKELGIYAFENMDAVCYGRIPEGSFGNLRCLNVDHCKRLKSFISLPMEEGRDGSVLPEMGSLDSTPDFSSTGTSGTQVLSTSDVPTPFFNEQVTLPSLKILNWICLDNVRAIWHNHLPAESFCKLKWLYLNSCSKLQNVFSINILKGLQSLEAVKIVYCDSLKEVFDLRGVNCKEIHNIATIPLRQLVLGDLYGLTSVWNKDPQGLVSFKKLQLLHIHRCPRLKCLLPVTIAEGLVELQGLRIEDCGVKEIVANENGGEAMSLLFPKLTSLTLRKLHKLKGFYPGTCIVRWPLLKSLIVSDCYQVETLFQAIDLEGYSPIQQPFFLLEKDAFHDLERLLVRGPKMKIWQDQFSRESFCNLRVLKIDECHDILVVIPSYMLAKLHNLEQLWVNKCNSVEEVFQMKELVVEEYQVEAFPRLTKMFLGDLPLLTYLSRSGPIFENLHSLTVHGCGSLIYLVTSSMAKTLVQLSKLTIEECKSVEEIVKNEGVEEQYDIVFCKLQRLTLSQLQSLRCFCSTRYTFKFPSLEQLKVSGCPEMEFFCKGVLSTPRVNREFSHLVEMHSGCDLNTIIHKIFLEKCAIAVVWFGEDPVDYRGAARLHFMYARDSIEEEYNEWDFGRSKYESWSYEFQIRDEDD